MIPLELITSGQIEQWVMDWYTHNPQQMKESDPALFYHAMYWYNKLYK